MKCVNTRRSEETTTDELCGVEHHAVEENLDKLREIADALDDATGAAALALIGEANGIVQQRVVQHERDDESTLHPKLSAQLADAAGLAAMSRAHREIQHLARLLQHLFSGLTLEDTDRYLIRDALRVIESLEALVRLHNAQEEGIYVVCRWGWIFERSADALAVMTLIKTDDAPISAWHGPLLRLSLAVLIPQRRPVSPIHETGK